MILGRKIVHWTTDEIKTVVNLWETKTNQEIAEELNRTPKAVVQLAAKIRAVGYPLKKKHQRSVLQNLIKQALNLN